MSIPTASELALLRSRPHQAELHLSAFQPTTALACQVNDVNIARGARSITFDTVSAGAYTNVEADYVMLVGTSAGASDKGRIRVRSATSTVITVAENSDISWADNLYLTVLKYVDITPIFPRIIQDPAKATNVIFYKDYDIAYTNQNSVLGSFICATNHKAGFLTTGSYQAYWTATGTFNVLGESLTYLWEFEGGTPSTYVGMEPGYVNYAASGQHYQTKLTVTGSSANDVAYRYVSVYDRPGEGSNTPILRWELSELSGSRSGGGWNAKVRIYDDVSAIQANTLIVIFADEIFGSTQQNIGGNAKNNSSIKFVGYVVDGSISYNWREGYVEFEVESPTGLMSRKQGFSVSCESKASPSTWFEILDLSVTRAIYHYLRWHSTVLKVCDFQYTGQDYKVQYFDADRESLYDAIAKFVQTGLHGEVVCDAQGKIWVEIGPDATTTPETDFPITLTMDKRDWMGDPAIDERMQNEYSYIEYNGIAYSGIVTGSFAALMAGAPGSAPAYVGGIDRQSGLILLGQSQLNTLTGNIFAYKNSRFPNIEFNIAGNYANLDIAPLQRVEVNLAQTDTPRGIVLTNEPFHINRIEWRYDAHAQTLVPTVSVSQLVNGIAAETIPIPPTPKATGYKVPKISIPSIPAITFPSFDFSGLRAGALYYIFLNADGGLAGHSGDSPTMITWLSQRVVGSTPSFIFPFSNDYAKVGFSYAGIYLLTCNVGYSTGGDEWIWVHGGGVPNDANGIRTASPTAISGQSFPLVASVFYASANNYIHIEGSQLNTDVDQGSLMIARLL